jgi:hypothetical protein
MQMGVNHKPFIFYMYVNVNYARYGSKACGLQMTLV